MANSLSNFINNLVVRIHKTECNMDIAIKNAKLAELNTKIVSAFLNTKPLKMI